MNSMRLWYKVVALCAAVIMSFDINTKPLCSRKDGTLDNTFGIQGRVVTDMGDLDDVIHGLVILPNGRIVAAGITADDFALAGYSSFGVLDQQFGVNGKVTTDFAAVLNATGQVTLSEPSIDLAYAAALQKNCSGCISLGGCGASSDTDTRIVVAGASDALTPGVSAFAVARYKADGSLDTSFGLYGSGVTVIPMGLGDSGANAVAIQADNKIVLAGFVTTATTPSSILSVAIVRLTCDGVLDKTFGCDNSGMAVFSFGGTIDAASAVKIQKDGKIVIAGTTNAHGSYDFALARLTSQGTLDKTFGADHTGKVITDFAGDDTSLDVANALVLLDDCIACEDENATSIVALGYSDRDGGYDTALAGYTRNGVLDPHFGKEHTGLVVTDVPNVDISGIFAATVVRLCNGKCFIVGAGMAITANLSDFMLQRYTINGILDKSFGNQGIVQTNFGVNGDEAAFAVTIQENGYIIAGGQTGQVTEGTDYDFALARYTECTPCCAEVCATGCTTSLCRTIRADE